MTELLVLNDGKQEMQAVSLDGTRVRTLITGLDELPDGIVVDQARGHVYWTNMGAPDPGSTGGDLAYTRNGSLERADLDGGNRVTIVPRGAFTTGKQLTADFDDGRAVLVRSGGHAGAVLQSRRQRPTPTGDNRCWRRGSAHRPQPLCRHRCRSASAPAVLDAEGRAECR